MKTTLEIPDLLFIVLAFDVVIGVERKSW